MESREEQLSPNELYELLLQEAKQYERAGNYEKPIDQYIEAATLDTNRFEAHWRHAKALEKNWDRTDKVDFDEVMKSLKRAEDSITKKIKQENQHEKNHAAKDLGKIKTKILVKIHDFSSLNRAVYNYPRTLAATSNNPFDTGVTSQKTSLLKTSFINEWVKPELKSEEEARSESSSSSLNRESSSRSSNT